MTIGSLHDAADDGSAAAGMFGPPVRSDATTSASERPPATIRIAFIAARRGDMPGVAHQRSLSFRGFADRLSEQRRYGDEPEHEEHEAREARVMDCSMA